MSKRNVIRLASFCLFAVIVAAGLYIKEYNKNQQYRLQIENTYSKSLEDLNAGINNISLVLQKAQYVNSPAQISSMAAKLISEAETAKTALSQLPMDNGELTVLNRFLSQVGNYAMSVSKSLILGGAITDEQKNNLAVLSSTANKVSEVINNSQINYNNADYWASELDRALTDALPEESLAGSLNELEKNLADYPTLIYDGPYSDHILEKEPIMIKDTEPVTREKALETAATVSGLTVQDLNYDGSDEGKIPTYRFSNDSVSVTVSRNGGYPVYMRKTRAVGTTSLDCNQALEKARRYLNNLSYGNLTETYYYTDEGVCVINFAYLDGQTVCYTDLIKVGVAMDTGEIMLLECSGYLTNHTERAFETPTVTAEQAKERLSPSLTVKESALALIPTDGANEVRCYEFLCSSDDGKEILIYINAVNLEEERILILLRSDGGTLVK